MTTPTPDDIAAFHDASSRDQAAMLASPAHVWVVLDARDDAERDASENRVLGAYFTEDEMNVDLPALVSQHSGEWAAEQVPIGGAAGEPVPDWQFSNAEIHEGARLLLKVHDDRALRLLIVQASLALRQSENQPRYRIDFHDEYTGEGGDLGIETTSLARAQLAVLRSWRETVADMDPSLYVQRLPRWDVSHTVATQEYEIRPGRRFKATYTIRVVTP